jgi:N-acyl homoserine lactone hydrolase
MTGWSGDVQTWLNLEEPVTYDLDLVVEGYPGKTTSHGFLGWSTVALLRGDGRVVMIDTGGPGMRPLLRERLQNLQIEPADITDVLLTHAHYDHAANYLLYPQATVWVSAEELEWAGDKPAEFDAVPELIVADLCRNDRVVRILGDKTDAELILPGIYALRAPGHTPGSVIYLVKSSNIDMIFTGDAVKNRAELVSTSVEMTLDVTASIRTLEDVRDLWKSTPNALLVPGHDLPLRYDANSDLAVHVGHRKVGITAWLGNDLADTMHIDLAP